MSSPNLFVHGYALLIGVDANHLSNLALPDVAKDIAALDKVLTDPKRCAYQAEHVRVIAGTEATRQNIIEALEWLQEVIAADKSGNATAFIYYSGHGWRDTATHPPQYYLIPYDMREDRFRSRALRAEDFAEAIEAIQVQRLCVVLDCCHAGGMGVKGTEGLSDRYSGAAIPASLFMSGQQGNPVGAAAKGIEVLQQGTGRAVLSSSQSHQPSYIRKDKQMSIFTYHLVEALSGAAQPQSGATEVLVSDVFSYVYRHVPQSAGTAYGVDQTPDGQLTGNFPIALLNDNKSIAQVATQSDYAEDIKRLHQYTRTSLNLLAEHSNLYVGMTPIKVARDSTPKLRELAEAGHALVVGEPGSGKSGVLYNLIESLEQHNVVLILAGRVEAHDQQQLCRHLQNLSHELADVLNHWVGDQPSFLVIDALDAARDTQTMQTIRDVISQVVRSQSRWRVVVSIRKYDLRYHREIQRLFAGTPVADYHEPEFSHLRHINIVPFLDEELVQLREQSSALSALLNHSTPELYEMLRFPFNLRLAGELIGYGVNIAELSPVQAQSELLELYWQYRVIGSDRHGDGREALLRQATKEMLQSHSLLAPRSSVAGITSSAILDGLLQSHVLIEWQATDATKPERYLLTFPHHILFDYAVARLIFRDALLAQLVADHELVLTAYPSIVHHFQYLWRADTSRKRFWDQVTKVVSHADVPEIGKLIGPSVAVEAATDINDFALLITMLTDPDKPTASTAELIWQHIIGAFLTLPQQPEVQTTNNLLWYQIGEQLSRLLRPILAHLIASLLNRLVIEMDSLDTKQRSLAGVMARRLLAFAWQYRLNNRWVVRCGIWAVCRTYENDVTASYNLLTQALAPEHLAAHAYEELPLFVNEIGRLTSIAPDFVEQLFSAVFTYSETSTEKVQMGSLIVPMHSNRQQDVAATRYIIAEAFPRFLESHPLHAIRALITVTNHSLGADPKSPIEKFDFYGKEALIQADSSSIWDNATRNDDVVKMLNAFETYLGELSHTNEQQPLRQAILAEITTRNRSAVIWRRLLTCGSKYPQTLGREICTLAWAYPVLMGRDTRPVMFPFLAAIFPHCTSEERQCIELAILTIPDQMPSEKREFGLHMRDRLLVRLSDNLLVTEPAKQLVAVLLADEDISATEKRTPSGEATVLFDREEDYLVGAGIAIDETPNRLILQQIDAIKPFLNHEQDTSLSDEIVSNVLLNLHALHDQVLYAEADGVHPELVERAWGYLATAAKKVADQVSITCESDEGSFLRSIFLGAARCKHPTFQEEADQNFHEFPSWEWPAARIDAAAGLIYLVRLPSCADAEVFAVIERLGQDAVAAVRLQIAWRLRVLQHTNADLMWRLLETYVSHEENRGVLQTIVQEPLSYLAHTAPDRVAMLVKSLMDRVVDGPGAEKVRTGCVSILLELYLQHDQPLCKKLLFALAQQPHLWPNELHRLLFGLRVPLTLGPIEPTEPSCEAVRTRALKLVECVIQTVCHLVHAFDQGFQTTSFDLWEEERKEKVRNVVQVAVSIARELYFASGAYQPEETHKQTTSAQTMVAAKRRFYQETGQLTHTVATLGIAEAVYDSLQTLAYLVEVDPRQIFLQVRDIVVKAAEGGYETDPLAAEQMVRLIEQYFAQYRYFFQQDEVCRQALIQVLDIFVKAGWPSACQLIYRMSNLFR